MAKNKKQKSSGGSAIYVVAGIIFAVVIIFCTGAFAIVNNRKDTISSINKQSTTSIGTIKEELITINSNVLMLIQNLGDADSLTKDISNSFKVIDEMIEQFESSGTHTEAETKRFDQTKSYINSLRRGLSEYQTRMNDLTQTQAKQIFIQELVPYQNSAIEMCDAVIDINGKVSAESAAVGARIFRMVEVGMGVILIVGEIAIFIAARIAKKSREELERKEKQAEAANIKFKHSQEKVNEIAFTNILTGMKNRYALEEDLAERLETEDFNIAVFDMDNFRSINDIYGYDFGDEYLVQISERLKNDFSESAELYNISGNEFCVVFKRDISDVQAMRMAETIMGAMGSVYTVANLGIQLTVSASTYHYHAGDCMNLSALLVKMDNVIRNVKRNGGNGIMNVMGM